MKRFLLLLTLISLFLRLFFVNKIPNELFGDELDVGYQAYSLLHTGRDLYSRSLPFYPKSLSEFRLPVLIYSSVLPISLFGLNSYSVRLPEVIFGSLGPIILFLLVLKTSRNRNLAIFSSIFLTISPWHIHYSRSAFEVVIMLNLVMLGALLYLHKKPILSAIFFTLTFYTYSTSIVFVPLFLLSLVFFQKKLPTLKFVITSTLLLLPFLYFLLTGTVGSRYQLLSIFHNPDITKNTILLRNSTKFPYEFLFTNKFQATGEYFIQNYLRAFSTDFLFIKGDPTIRQSFIISGELLPILAPFILIGLGVLIFEKQYFWLYWLLISPVPSALTYDGGYHATRLFFMLAPLSICTAAGYWHILKYSKIISHFLVFSLILSNFIYLGHYYLIHYPRVSWRWWQVGYEQVFTDLSAIAGQYPKIYINNTYEPSLVRFLFYTKYDPHLFQKQFTLDQTIKDIAPNYDGYKLGDKFIFGTFSDKVNKYNLGSFLQPDSLYLISARDEIPLGQDWSYDKPAGVDILAEINSPENTHLFYLITKSK